MPLSLISNTLANVSLVLDSKIVCILLYYFDYLINLVIRKAIVFCQLNFRLQPYFHLTIIFYHMDMHSFFFVGEYLE